MNRADQQRRLAALRRAVGRSWCTYRFPTLEGANEANEALQRGGPRSLGAFVHSIPSSSACAYLTIITESDAVLEAARDAVHEAVLACEGAREVDNQPDPVTLEQFRARRWNAILGMAALDAAEALEKGGEPRGRRMRAHYGQGVLLADNGALEPYKRPQG